MSRENVELARHAVAAFNERDVSALVTVTTDDFEWRTLTGGALDSTVYRGPDGIAAYFRDTEEVWETMRIEAREFRDLGDSMILVVATLYARGAGSGADVQLPFFGVFRLRAEKIAEARSFTSEREAFEALGLRE